MSSLRFVFLGFIFFVYAVASPPNRLVHMQPEVVTLKGFAKVMLCAGPPNYDDIKKGDRPESCGYLFLNDPIDVDVLPNVEELSAGMDQPEKMVRIIQMVYLTDDYWGYLSKTSGKYVQIKGTLFSYVTGHHHVRVLIGVQKMKEINGKGLELAYKHANEIKTCKQMMAEDEPEPSLDPA